MSLTNSPSLNFSQSPVFEKPTNNIALTNTDLNVMIQCGEIALQMLDVNALKSNLSSQEISDMICDTMEKLFELKYNLSNNQEERC